MTNRCTILGFLWRVLCGICTPRKFYGAKVAHALAKTSQWKNWLHIKKNCKDPYERFIFNCLTAHVVASNCYPYCNLRYLHLPATLLLLCCFFYKLSPNVMLILILSDSDSDQIVFLGQNGPIPCSQLISIPTLQHCDVKWLIQCMVEWFSWVQNASHLCFTFVVVCQAVECIVKPSYCSGGLWFPKETVHFVAAIFLGGFNIFFVRFYWDLKKMLQSCFILWEEVFFVSLWKKVGHDGHFALHIFRLLAFFSIFWLRQKTL